MLTVRFLFKKRFINGKVVLSKWNPTNRRFRAEKGKLMGEALGETSNHNKGVNTDNPFDVLQGQEELNKDQTEEINHKENNNTQQANEQSKSIKNTSKKQQEKQGEKDNRNHEIQASEVPHIDTSICPTTSADRSKDDYPTENVIVIYDKEGQSDHNENIQEAPEKEFVVSRDDGENI